MGNDLFKGPLLVKLQHRLKSERARHSDDSLVCHIQAAPGLRDEGLQPFRQAARQHQVAIGALLELRRDRGMSQVEARRRCRS